jgi:hypothetical protein
MGNNCGSGWGTVVTGGGGGAIQVGSNGVGSTCGNGVEGYGTSITGSFQVFSSGGGGGGRPHNAIGGTGAGNAGKPGTSGVANRGGGGGDEGTGTAAGAGSGGSGIVVVGYNITDPLSLEGSVYKRW